MPKPVLFISIPKGLPSKLAASSRELKAVCIWYRLKSLYVGGVIRNFSRNAQAIAHTFGFSERKLRTYVTLLTQRGYIEKPTRHDIVLRSKTLLTAEYGVSKYCYKVSCDELHKLEEIMDAYAVQEGMARQQYRINQKLQSDYLRRNGKLCSSILHPNAKRKALKGFKLGQEQDAAQARFQEQVQGLRESKTGLRPFATYSRQGLANCFGRTSKSSGLRRAKKLVQAGLLVEKAHTIYVSDCTYTQYLTMRRAGLACDPSYRFSNGRLLKVMPHQLTILL